MPKRRLPNRVDKHKRSKATKGEPVSFQHPREKPESIRDADDTTDAVRSSSDAQKVLQLCGDGSTAVGCQVVVNAVKTGKHPELRLLLTEPGWREMLKVELEKEYVDQLQAFLESEWDRSDAVVYPTAQCIFDAFRRTPFNRVRVVLLGQDPYHGIDQATGLCFSVPKEQKLPSSLRNVFKEIKSDVGYSPGNHGDLTRWAEQGVLLLNTVLTVRGAKAHSHKKQGWEKFTNAVISALNEKCNGLVFFLWGAHAQHVGKALDEERHLVLKAPHPSGLSAHRGFFGCKHFSKCNAYLESMKYDPIDWRVQTLIETEPEETVKEIPVEHVSDVTDKEVMKATPSMEDLKNTSGELTVNEGAAADSRSKDESNKKILDIDVSTLTTKKEVKVSSMMDVKAASKETQLKEDIQVVTVQEAAQEKPPTDDASIDSNCG